MSESSESTIVAHAPSVPLPRHSDTVNRNAKPPVWPIDASAPSQIPPLAAKCARNSRADGICCKELKGDDDRTLIDPDVVRDV